MSDLSKKRLTALKRCTFVPGTNTKRFVMDTPLDAKLTDRQKHYIEILAWRYRRQIPASLVPEQKPADLPPKQKNKAPTSAKENTAPRLPNLD